MIDSPTAVDASQDWNTKHPFDENEFGFLATGVRIRRNDAVSEEGISTSCSLTIGHTCNSAGGRP